jgi:hypothetical protein
MSHDIARMDPRITAIIKELVAWDDTEFDNDGRPVRKEGGDSDTTCPCPCPCPDTVIDSARRALRDMKNWALEGRRDEARRALDEIERD